MIALNAIKSLEFGVCRGTLSDDTGTLVPIDPKVKDMLVKMVQSTLLPLGDNRGYFAEPYEPSQLYDTESKASLALESPYAKVFFNFFSQVNRPMDGSAMESPQAITAYFCLIENDQGKRLIAIRRSAQFKAVLKARLLRFVDDTMKALDDDIFKLDHDFDLIIVEDKVLINRVTAFEFLAGIDEQVQQAAVENVQHLGTVLSYIDFQSIVEYVGQHKRAARLAAALRCRSDLSDITRSNLRRECKRSGVLVTLVDGKFVPKPGHEMALLQMLDRRRYSINLIHGKHEQYEAGSRKAAGVRLDEGARPPVRKVRTSMSGG